MVGTTNLDEALGRLPQAGIGVIDIENPMFDIVRLYDELAVHTYEFRCAFDRWLAGLATAPRRGLRE